MRIPGMPGRVGAGDRDAISAAFLMWSRAGADLRSPAAHHRLRSFVFSAFSRSVHAAIRVDRAIHA